MTTHEIKTAIDLDDLEREIRYAQNSGLEVAAMTYNLEEGYVIVFKRSS